MKRNAKQKKDLSLNDILIGMCVFLPADAAYSEQQLRAFLRVDAQQHPRLRDFLSIVPGSTKDVLSIFLRKLNGGILLWDASSESFHVRGEGREDFRSLLVAENVYKSHEYFYRGLAERFLRFVSSSRP